MDENFFALSEKEAADVAKHIIAYLRYGAVPLYEEEIKQSGNLYNQFGVYDYHKSVIAYATETQYNAMAIAHTLNEKHDLDEHLAKHGRDLAADLPDFVQRKTLNLEWIDEWTEVNQ
jgi:hypothetical protein